MIRNQLLKDRYFVPGETTERQMYERVARFISRGDKTYCQTLNKAMAEYYWLPNTPTLVNAGRVGAGGLSACYVLPIEDSLDGIYKTVWDAAKVHKAFGGTGFNFSHLRERGAPIKSTGGRACGPIKVMQLLNTSAGVVSQGGKRDGANMGILNASHPGIHEFIRCKDSDTGLTHFNISVGLTDKDMRDEQLLQEIAEHAWRTGDPGVIFLDRLNENNRRPDLGDIEATNPCGEQPLRAYESCNLASINLGKLVGDHEFKFGTLVDVVELSVRALNDIIDLNTYPIPEIEKATLASRKIGSGIMGWADTLIQLGISYQSTEALNLADQIGSQYLETATLTAKAYGNETVMTIAPTGTLSYLAGCSWGIEPVFDWKYERESESGKELIDHPLYQLAKDNGLLNDIAPIISPEWQVLHVAKWQQYADNGVSKTINLPASATVEDVLKIIKLAHKNKCKGITVYRDGSKKKQVVVSASSLKKGGTTRDAVQVGRSGQRTYGSRAMLQSGCGKIRVECDGLEDAREIPYEVVVLTSGGCKANNEFTGKLISKYIHDPRLAGDEETTIKRICHTAHKVECSTAMMNKKSMGKSCADIIAKEMEFVWLAKTTKPVDNDKVCPQCGAKVDFGSGCRSGACHNCGWSGCS